jgi:hypothetical protein
MREIPRTSEPLLVRTDFSNEIAWRALVHEASQGYEDDFRANLHFVDDKSFDGTEPVDIASAAKSTGHPVLFVADGTTLSNAEHLVLCISLHGLGSFRVPPNELWSIENNLSLANMDFEEFAEAVDPDGVFRGFPH